MSLIIIYICRYIYIIKFSEKYDCISSVLMMMYWVGGGGGLKLYTDKIHHMHTQTTDLAA